MPTPKIHLIALLAAASVIQVANAALPQAQAPSRGEGKSWMQTLQNYGYDGFMLLGLPP